MPELHAPLAYKRLIVVSPEIETGVTRTIDVSGYRTFQEVTFVRRILHALDVHMRAVLSIAGREIWRSSSMHPLGKVALLVGELREAVEREVAETPIPGLVATLEIEIEDVFYDVITARDFREREEPRVARVPRDWRLSDLEAVLPGGKRTFYVENSGDGRVHSSEFVQCMSRLMTSEELGDLGDRLRTWTGDDGSVASCDGVTNAG